MIDGIEISSYVSTLNIGSLINNLLNFMFPYILKNYLKIFKAHIVIFVSCLIYKKKNNNSK